MTLSTARTPSFFDVFYRATVLVLMLVVLAGSFAADVDAATKRKHHKSTAPRYIPPTSSIVIDADTGAVLSSERADSQMHPASLTKMMTLLLTFDALSARHMRLNDYISVSSRAANASPSKLGLRAGSRIRLDDAIKAVAVKSANDMAIALAEALAGSEARFSIRMNERARSIGMTRTRFYNASGLHNPGQLTTARDMAILGRYIIKTYPTYYRYFSLASFEYDGKTIPNHNKLMGRYEGMDGMKTGYISQSGFNLVASAVQGNRRLIGVVFGGRTGRSRDDHMADLLDRGFNIRVRPTTPKLDIARLSNNTDNDSDEEEATAIITPVQNPPVSPTAPTPEMANIPAATPDVGPAPASMAPVVSFSPKGVAVPSRKPDLAPARGVTVDAQGPLASKPDGLSTPPIAGILGTLTNTPATPAVAAARSQYGWTVQIGAYQNRDATDRALYEAVKILPKDLSHANPIVAPLKSVESGWLFRARLGNLNEAQAKRVCTYFRGCLMIAPESY